MQLEDYFRLSRTARYSRERTRVGIETILAAYLDWGLSPEAIAERYRTLTLEQVYATLTFYWHDPSRGDDYLRRVQDEIARQRREQDLHPSPGVQRLRSLARVRDEAKRRVLAAT